LFREKELEYQPDGLFSSGGKLWRDGKIAVHANQPGGIEGAAEVLQASADFGIASILGRGVVVQVMNHRGELLKLDIQAKKLGLL
jgi:hypothetical protein